MELGSQRKQLLGYTSKAWPVRAKPLVLAPATAAPPAPAASSPQSLHNRALRTQDPQGPAPAKNALTDLGGYSSSHEADPWPRRTRRHQQQQPHSDLRVLPRPTPPQTAPAIALDTPSILLLPPQLASTTVNAASVAPADGGHRAASHGDSTPPSQSQTTETQGTVGRHRRQRQGQAHAQQEAQEQQQHQEKGQPVQSRGHRGLGNRFTKSRKPSVETAAAHSLPPAAAAWKLPALSHQQRKRHQQRPSDAQQPSGRPNTRPASSSEPMHGLVAEQESPAQRHARLLQRGAWDADLTARLSRCNTLTSLRAVLQLPDPASAGPTSLNMAHNTPGARDTQRPHATSTSATTASATSTSATTASAASTSATTASAASSGSDTTTGHPVMDLPLSDIHISALANRMRVLLQQPRSPSSHRDAQQLLDATLQRYPPPSWRTCRPGPAAAILWALAQGRLQLDVNAAGYLLDAVLLGSRALAQGAGSGGGNSSAGARSPVAQSNTLLTVTGLSNAVWAAGKLCPRLLAQRLSALAPGLTSALPDMTFPQLAAVVTGLSVAPAGLPADLSECLTEELYSRDFSLCGPRDLLTLITAFERWQQQAADDGGPSTPSPMPVASGVQRAVTRLLSSRRLLSPDPVQAGQVATSAVQLFVSSARRGRRPRGKLHQQLLLFIERGVQSLGLDSVSACLYAMSTLQAPPPQPTQPADLSHTADSTPLRTPDVLRSGLGGKAEVTPEITREVTPEVTPEITREVTPEVTPEITREVTPEVTPEITREVTPEITREVTPEITREVTQSSSTAGAPAGVTQPATRGGMSEQWYLTRGALVRRLSALLGTHGPRDSSPRHPGPPRKARGHGDSSRDQPQQQETSGVVTGKALSLAVQALAGLHVAVEPPLQVRLAAHIEQLSQQPGTLGLQDCLALLNSIPRLGLSVTEDALMHLLNTAAEMLPTVPAATETAAPAATGVVQLPGRQQLHRWSLQQQAAATCLVVASQLVQSAAKLRLQPSQPWLPLAAAKVTAAAAALCHQPATAAAAGPSRAQRLLQPPPQLLPDPRLCQAACALLWAWAKLGLQWDTPTAAALVQIATWHHHRSLDLPPGAHNQLLAAAQATRPQPPPQPPVLLPHLLRPVWPQQVTGGPVLRGPSTPATPFTQGSQPQTTPQPLPAAHRALPGQQIEELLSVLPPAHIAMLCTGVAAHPHLPHSAWMHRVLPLVQSMSVLVRLGPIRACVVLKALATALRTPQQRSVSGEQGSVAQLRHSKQAVTAGGAVVSPYTAHTTGQPRATAPISTTAVSVRRLLGPRLFRSLPAATRVLLKQTTQVHQAVALLSVQLQLGLVPGQRWLQLFRGQVQGHVQQRGGMHGRVFVRLVHTLLACERALEAAHEQRLAHARGRLGLALSAPAAAGQQEGVGSQPTPAKPTGAAAGAAGGSEVLAARPVRPVLVLRPRSSVHAAVGGPAPLSRPVARAGPAGGYRRVWTHQDALGVVKQLCRQLAEPAVVVEKDRAVTAMKGAAGRSTRSWVVQGGSSEGLRRRVEWAVSEVRRVGGLPRRRKQTHRQAVKQKRKGAGRRVAQLGSTARR